MPDPRYLVLMFTPENPPQDYDRLREAITACCTARPLGSAPSEEDTAGNFAALARELAEKDPRCTIREAILAPQEVVPAEESLGRVCAMPTVSCPPAIPIVVSGEMVSREAVTLMKRYGVANVAVIKWKNTAEILSSAVFLRLGRLIRCRSLGSPGLPRPFSGSRWRPQRTG